MINTTIQMNGCCGIMQRTQAFAVRPASFNARRPYSRTVAASSPTSVVPSVEEILATVKCSTLGQRELMMSWDEAPNDNTVSAWHSWMASELAAKLVGVSAGTSRAEVRTTGVKSANVVQGAVRAEELDVVLELEATHKKTGYRTSGAVRLVLKTADHRDHICLSDVQWATDVEQGSDQVMTDIMTAAEMPLESALACHLNDLLWDVEHRSISLSMDESWEEEV